MSLITAVGLVLLGLVLLVGGGELLLRGAVGLARWFSLTPAVIGLTVVAAGTSIPELAVSLIAAMNDSPDLCTGNVVGSNLSNITLVLGTCALIRPLAITGNTIRLEYPVMALVTLMYLAIAQDGILNWLDGTLLLTVQVLFTVYMLSLVRQQATIPELKEFSEDIREKELVKDQEARPGISMLLVLGGIVLLSAGAQSTVAGAVELALRLGMSERVVGLTVVAIGTSLPELVSSAVSCYRGREDVAIGNLLGSNLFNLLGILGITSLVSPLPVSQDLLMSDHWWMMGVSLLLFPIMLTGRRVSRGEGALLLGVYVTYLTLLLR